MSNKYEQKWNQVSYRYGLLDTLSDADFRAAEGYHHQMPGLRRWENGIVGQGVYKEVYVHGDAYFAWVCNRSGDNLNRGALTKWHSLAVTGDSAGSTTTIADADAFTADHEVWNVVIIDDAVAAAPEGQWGVILKNTAGVLTLQTAATNRALTAAFASGDSAEIRSRCMVLASAIGDQAAEIAGLIVAETLANDYWGWICLKSHFVSALIKASTALTQDDGLIADTGRLTISNSSGQDLILGYTHTTSENDRPSDLVCVSFDSDGLLATTA